MPGTRSSSNSMKLPKSMGLIRPSWRGRFETLSVASADFTSTAPMFRSTAASVIQHGRMLRVRMEIPCGLSRSLGAGQIAAVRRLGRQGSLGLADELRKLGRPESNIRGGVEEELISLELEGECHDERR